MIVGEIGKEMYVVNRGKLQVLSEGKSQVLAELNAGSYFGEISILNMGTEGNKRTASVVSVGYSDLFCLSKKDIWAVLEDYPAARERLEFIAQKRLHQPHLNSGGDKKSTKFPNESLTSKYCSHVSSSPPSIINIVLGWRSLISPNQAGIECGSSRSVDTLINRRTTTDVFLVTPKVSEEKDLPITHNRSKGKLKPSRNQMENQKQPESYI